MKEIVIPAAAIFSIFGLPILMMLIAVVATMLEKPRWVLQSQSIIKNQAAHYAPSKAHRTAPETEKWNHHET